MFHKLEDIDIESNNFVLLNAENSFLFTVFHPALCLSICYVNCQLLSKIRVIRKFKNFFYGFIEASRL